MVWQPIRRAKEATASGVPPPMTPPMGSAFLWGSKIALNHLGVVVIVIVIVAERALQAVVVSLVAQGITWVALATSGKGVAGNWCRLHHKTRLTSVLALVGGALLYVLCQQWTGARFEWSLGTSIGVKRSPSSSLY